MNSVEMAGLEDIQSGVRGMMIDDSDSFDSADRNKEITYIPNRSSLVAENEITAQKSVP